MSKFRTHYDNLKVARNAPDSIIRAAYKTLMQQYHPDKFEGSVDEALRIAKLIKQSYDVLIDPAKRAEHDRWIKEKEAKTEPDIHKAQFQQTSQEESNPYSSKAASKDYPGPTPNSRNTNNASRSNTMNWPTMFAVLVLLTACVVFIFHGSSTDDTWEKIFSWGLGLLCPVLAKYGLDFNFAGRLKADANNENKSTEPKKPYSSKSESQYSWKNKTSKIRQAGSAIILIIIFLTVKGISEMAGKSTAKMSLMNEKQTTIENSVNEINKKTPITVDSETILYKAEAENSRIVYFYSFPKHSRLELSKNYDNNALKIIVKDKVCKNNDIKKLINMDISLVFVYHGNDKQEIGRFEINRFECDINNSNHETKYPISNPLEDMLSPPPETPKSEINQPLDTESQAYVKVATELVSLHPELGVDGPIADKVLALADIYRSQGMNSESALRKAVETHYDIDEPQNEYEIGMKLYKENKYNDAIKHLEKSANQNNLKAQAMMADIYYEGTGAQFNYDNTAKWCQSAATRGDIKSQVILAKMYLTGRGVSEDHSQAVFWFKKAAANGNPKAQMFLGQLYWRGDGVKQDAEKSKYWWIKAAKQGEESALKVVEQENWN